MEDTYMCNLPRGHCKLGKGSRRDMDIHMDNSTEADIDTDRDSSCLPGWDNNMGKSYSIDTASGMNMKICSPYPNCTKYTAIPRLEEL